MLCYSRIDNLPNVFASKIILHIEILLSILMLQTVNIFLNVSGVLYIRDVKLRVQRGPNESV